MLILIAALQLAGVTSSQTPERDSALVAVQHFIVARREAWSAATRGWSRAVLAHPDAADWTRPDAGARGDLGDLTAPVRCLFPPTLAPRWLTDRGRQRLAEMGEAGFDGRPRTEKAAWRYAHTDGVVASEHTGVVFCPTWWRAPLPDVADGGADRWLRPDDARRTSGARSDLVRYLTILASRAPADSVVTGLAVQMNGSPGARWQEVMRPRSLCCAMVGRTCCQAIDRRTSPRVTVARFC